MMEFSKRKWGWYLTLWSARAFKVKLLWFRKGASCSMQRHFKRDELWCFLFGEGYLAISEDDEPEGRMTRMKGGDCGVVPIAKWHRFLATKCTLVLEIQTGECREDDIERA